METEAMICKYCGSQYSGNICTSCGKTIPLVKRSTDLDLLMSNTKSEKPGKTYEQGIKEGYQKGLSEGYNNGYADGRRSGNPGESPKTPVPKNIILVLLSLCLLLPAISGYIFNNSGYNHGYQKGNADAQATIEDEKKKLEKDYDIGFDEGKKQGLEEGKKQGLEEGKKQGLEEGKKQGLEEGREKGRKEAKEQYESQIEKEKQTVNNTSDKLINMFECDFPYSKERYYGKDNPVVKKIQQQLKDLGFKGYKELDVDGKFGSETEKAIKSFQGKNNLNKSGIVDLETYKKLFPEASIYVFEPQEDQKADSDQTMPESQENNNMLETPSILPETPSILPETPSIPPETPSILPETPSIPPETPTESPNDIDLPDFLDKDNDVQEPVENNTPDIQATPSGGQSARQYII